MGRIGRRVVSVWLLVALMSAGWVGVTLTARSAPPAGAASFFPSLPDGVPASFPADAKGPDFSAAKPPKFPGSPFTPVADDADFGHSSRRATFSSVPVRLQADPGALDAGSHAHIEILDAASAGRVTATGLAFRVQFTRPSTGAVEVPSAPVHAEIDYSKLASMFGGDFGSRLRVVGVPECRLAAKVASGCPAMTPLTTERRDPERTTVTVDVSEAGEARPLPALIGTTEDRRGLAAAGLPQTFDPAAAPQAKAALAAGDAVARAVGVIAPEPTGAAGADGGFAGGVSTFAVTSSTSGSSGDFGQTPVTGLAAGSVGLQSGSAESSYPITVPPARFGPTPKVELGYSSASVDGFTPDKNTQSSEWGLGWNSDFGSITRSYKSCNLPNEAPGDLCWNGATFNNYSITINGMTETLVPINFAATEFRMEHDTGWKISMNLSPFLAGVDQTAAGQGAEFWVTGPDGAVYRFGGITDPYFGQATGSTYSVPVYSPNPGDPCYNSPAHMCLEAWKWNLQWVQDPSGNAMRYAYAQNTNQYNVRSGLAGSITMPYQPSGEIAEIAYGLDTKVANQGSAFVGRVLFDHADRCVGFGCNVFSGQAAWPDTPWDLYCGSPTGCANTSPSFWNPESIAQIRTQFFDNTPATPLWVNVRIYQLMHSFPDPGLPGAGFTASTLTTPPKMVLDSIRRVDPSLDDAGQLAPPARRYGTSTFTYVALPNRVNYPAGSGVPPLMTERLATVTNELGGQTEFTYGQMIAGAFNGSCQATPVDMNFFWHDPAGDRTKMDCFPVFYGPEGDPSPFFTLMQKYQVDQMRLIDRAAGGATQTYSYSYFDGPYWHYSNEGNLADYDGQSLNKPYRYWNEYRGFREVRVTNTNFGDVERHKYLTGMDGEKYGVVPGNAGQFANYKSMSVTDLENHFTVTDSSAASGREIENWKTDGSNVNAALSGSETQYASIQIQGPTGPGTWGQPYRGHQTWFVGPQTVDTFAPTAVTPTRVSYVYNTTDQNAAAPSCQCNYGTVVQENHEGMAYGSDANESHTEYSYVNNSGWMRGLVGKAVERHGLTGGAGAYIGQTSYGYDNAAVNSNFSGRGLVTRTRSYTDVNAGTFVDTLSGYDGNGRVTSTTDGRNNATTTSYDSVYGAAKKVTVTNALNQSVVTDLNPAFGTPVKRTDANGNVTTATYDWDGRLLTVKMPTEQAGSQATKKFNYFTWGSVPPANGAPTMVSTDQLFKTTTTTTAYATSYQYLNGFGQQVQTVSTSPDKTVSTKPYVRTSTRIDGKGRTQRVSAPYATAGPPDQYLPPTWTGGGLDAGVSDTLTNYDAADRVTRVATVTDSTVKVATNTAYAPSNLTVTTTDPNGHVTDKTADYFGNLAQTVEYDGANAYTTSYGYDDAGRLKTLTDSLGNVTSNFYDQLGRKTSSTDPDAGATSYLYDNNGNLTQTTDARNQVVVRAYDALNRPTETRKDSAAGSLLQKFSYDAVGQKGLVGTSSSFDGSGNEYKQVDVAYDGNDRPTTVQWVIPAAASGLAGTYKFAYAYDPAGHVMSTQYPSNAAGGLGEKVDVTLDSGTMLPIKLAGTNNYVNAATYTAQGNLATQQLGGASVINRTLGYEPATYRLNLLQAKGGTSSTNNLQDLTYSFNQVGTAEGTDIANVLDSVNGGQRECYQYDNLNRLTRAFTGNSACTAPNTTTGANPYDRSYGYDQIGRFTSNNGRTYQYGDAAHKHAVTSAGTDTFTYDFAGNMTSRTVGGAGALMGWDPLGKMSTYVASGGTSTYVYGPDGQRILRADGTTRTLYLNGELYESKSANGATATTTLYYQLGSQRVAYRQGTTLKYLLSDPQGSSSVTTNNAGTSPTIQRYYPYGQIRSASGANALTTDSTYLGKTQDQTGLDMLGDRYYDPALAGFTSTDSLATPSQPQTLNVYGYSTNNPIVMSDPTGLKAQCNIVAMACWDDGQPSVPGSGASNPIERVTNQVVSGKNRKGHRISSRQREWDDEFLKGYRARGLFPGALEDACGHAEAAFQTAACSAAMGVTWHSVSWRVRHGHEESLWALAPFLAPIAIPVAAEIGGAAIAALGSSGVTKLVSDSAPEAVPATETEVTDIVVLGHFPEYVEAAEKVSGRTFQVPTSVWSSMSAEEQWTANQKFLDRAIARGSDIVLATPADAAREGSFFERELNYLQSQGYKPAPDGLSMIPPGSG